MLESGNQKGKPPIYDYYPTGLRRAILVHILQSGECSKRFESDGNHYVDNNKVFKRI